MGVLVLAVADVLEDAAVFCGELLVLGAAEFGVGVVHEVVEAVDVVAEVVDGDEDADGQRGDPHWLTDIEIREFEEYCEREVHQRYFMEHSQHRLQHRPHLLKLPRPPTHQSHP